MRKTNGIYVLSNTDIKRIEAHTRAVARRASYDGHVEAWFDRSAGTVDYYEIVGQGDMRPESEDVTCICWEDCYALDK